MHRVTLQDGTVLDGLTLNGNNYISDTIIDSDVFADNLATVEISDGKKSQVYEDMKLIANQMHDGKSWFILAEKTLQDKERERVDKVEAENETLKARISELEAVSATLITKEIITESDVTAEKELSK
jgi:hypothetical protein